MKMLTRRRICHEVLVLSMMLLCGVPGVGNAQEIGKDSEYASSLLRVIYENSASIVSYDLFIKEERLKSPPGQELKIGKRKARMLWSDELESGLYVTVGETEHLSSGAQENIQSGWTAAVYGKRQDCFFASSRGFRTIPCEAVELVRYRLGWPDVSTLGILAYPHVSSPDTNETIEQMLVPSQSLSAVTLSPTVVSISYRANVRKGLTIIHVWSIDVENFVPLERKSFVEEEGYPRYLKARETYEWEKRGNTFVPKRIVCDVVQSLRGEDGERVDYEVSTDTEFDWRVINEAIGPDQFNKSRIDSIEKIRAMVNW